MVTSSLRSPADGGLPPYFLDDELGRRSPTEPGGGRRRARRGRGRFRLEIRLVGLCGPPARINKGPEKRHAAKAGADWQPIQGAPRRSVTRKYAGGAARTRPASTGGGGTRRRPTGRGRPGPSRRVSAHAPLSEDQRVVGHGDHRHARGAQQARDRREHRLRVATCSSTSVQMMPVEAARGGRSSLSTSPLRKRTS